MAILRSAQFHHTDTANQHAISPARYSISQAHSIYCHQAKSRPSHAVRYRPMTKKVITKPSLQKLDIIRRKEPAPEQAPKLIKPAKTYWKTGHGSVEKVDQETGDIVHLVHEPAVYAQQQPEPTTASSQYRTKMVNTAAKYSLIRTRQPIKLKEKYPHSDLLPINLGQGTRTQCNNPVSAFREYKVVQRLQNSLKNRGYYIHAIDGVFGLATKMALSASQRLAKLPTGKLDNATIRHLGI